jgi:hypothetical protein
MPVYIALLHYPVYNKKKEIVTTCITGFDLHDIARTAITFGVKGYYVVNPMPAQQAFARRIIDFWMDEEALEFNWTRAEAFKLISIKSGLEEVVKDIEEIEGIKPKIIATSARDREKGKKVERRKLKVEIRNTNNPYLILFGTGWGLAEEAIEKADGILGPIQGVSEYNHLPVRSATAIILDRLLGV